MIDFPNITDICRVTESKIVMVVVDGLGGMRHPHFGMSELESAEIPVLDGLASQSDCGVTTPVLPGISPGTFRRPGILPGIFRAFSNQV